MLPVGCMFCKNVANPHLDLTSLRIRFTFLARTIMHYTRGAAPISRSERSYGIPTKSSDEIASIRSWPDLWDEVAQSLPPEAMLGDLEIPDEIFASAKEYYMAAAEQAKGQLKLTENQLTLRCLHPLACFDQVVLEDTSGAVRDYSQPQNASKASSTDEVGNGFRKMAYARHGKGVSDRVDIMGRLRTKFDLPANKIAYHQSLYEYTVEPKLKALAVPSHNEPLCACNASGVPVLPYLSDVKLLEPLPPWRTFPFHTVFIKELKRYSEELAAFVDQVAHYCESVLRVSPNRSVVFGVLTNMRSCIFIATYVVIEEGIRRYKSIHSQLIEDGFEEQMSMFVATTPRAHGHNFSFPVSRFIPVEFLGRGSTGAVMSGQWMETNEILPMKVSIYEQALQLERMILGYFERQGVQGVPQIHAAAQRDLSDPLLCGAFCNVYKEM